MKDKMRSALLAQADRYEIPEYMRDSLVSYLLDGTPVGHFLTAVLENNLKEAVARADDLNQRELANYVKFLVNCAPFGAWGSPGAPRKWRESLRGKEAS